MTGGIAYVLDDLGEFARVRCNRASVDLGPVIDPKDADLIQLLVTRHAELTGSPRAKWVLDNWEIMLPRFLKVFPHEYKRVLGQASAPATVGTGVALVLRSAGTLALVADPSLRSEQALKVGVAPATREALGG